MEIEYKVKKMVDLFILLNCIYLDITAERRASFVTATEDEEESDSDMDSEHVRRLGHDHSNPNSQSQGFSQNTEEVWC